MEKKHLHQLIVLTTLFSIFIGISKRNVCLGQDIHFSQLWMAPLFQNPAMAGVSYDLEAIINYKDQWQSLGSPYKTGNFSYDMKLKSIDVKKGFLAVGFNTFNDKAGDAQMKTVIANLSLAYHVRINRKNTLGTGLLFGLGQRSIDYTALKWASQYDGMTYNSVLPGADAAGNKFTYVDIGGGLVWAYGKGRRYVPGSNQVKANLGVSVFHPNQPRYSFYDTEEKLNMKSVIHGSFLYRFRNSHFSLIPNFVFYSQGKTKELTVGTLIRHTIIEESKYTGNIKGAALSVGMHYRNQDAFILSYLLELGQYALGISYDFNVSGLKIASSTRGGIEFSFRFNTFSTPTRITNSKARF